MKRPFLARPLLPHDLVRFTSRASLVALVVVGLLPGRPAAANPSARAGRLVVSPAEEESAPPVLDGPREPPRAPAASTVPEEPTPRNAAQFASEPPPKGEGLFIGGVALAVFAVPLTVYFGRHTFPLTGSGEGDVTGSSKVQLPVFLLAAGCAAASVAMLSVGGVRLVRWKRWLNGREPRLNAWRSSSGAWTVGASLRF